MDSPKAKKRPWSSKTLWKREPFKREGKTQDFYRHKRWRDTRKAYINYWVNTLREEVPQGFITIKSARFELEPHQQTMILDVNIPCEKCVKLYAALDRGDINEANQVDHIDPVNPENALLSNGWGDPFSFDNLQLLCYRHHAKKSNYDKKIIKLRQQ